MGLNNDNTSAPVFPYWPHAMLAALLLLTLLAGWLLFGGLYERDRRAALDNVTAVGTLRAHRIQDMLEDRLSDARTLSADPYLSREAKLWMVGGAHDDARRRQLDLHLSVFLENHHFRAIVLYDEAGHVMLNAGSRIPDERSMGAVVSDVVASGQTRFIDLHRHNDASLPTEMGYLSPLHDGERSFGALYLVEDPTQRLFPMLREWPSETDTAETQLVRADGDQVVFLAQLRNRPEPPLGFSLPLDTPRLAAAAALRGKLGALVKLHDYRGKQVLSYAIAIPGTSWVLISKIDDAEVVSGTVQLQRMAAMLVLVIFFVAAAWLRHWHRRERNVAGELLRKERMHAATQLREAEKRGRTFFEQASMPMLRCTLQGDIVEVNDAWCVLFGYSHEEVAAQHLNWRQLAHPDDHEAGESLLQQMGDGQIEGGRIEERLLRKDGTVVWGGTQAALFRDEHGKPESIACTIQDITGRKQAERQISFMAYHDKLTGLPNRALLFDRLSQGMSQAKRDSKFLALLFIDLDGFKAVNDRYGHEAGDAVLRMAAQRFLACVREVDTVARFGGDEFAIVLGNLDDPQQAKSVAKKIVQAFAQGMILPDGQECHVGASVGISVFPEHGSAMDSLITSADQAMYESKHQGKNRYTFFRETAPAEDDMQWIKFQDKHLLGISEIDEQHRNLVYLVNRLNALVKRNESAEAAQLVLDELLVATVHHFDTENRFMKTYHYPEQERHEEEHARLVAEAQGYKALFNQGRELLVLQSLKDWLLAHMAYSDKRLGAYLRQQGLK